MKKFRIASPKRNLAYTAFILFVLVVFLIGYFYYFIPTNKQTLHKNGFLILKTIAENIQSTSVTYREFASNLHKNRRKESSIANDNIRLTFRYDNTGKLSKKPAAVIRIEKDSLRILIKGENGDSSTAVGSLADFMESILGSQRSELFESYAILRLNGKNSELVYQDPDLGMRPDILIDTLLPKNVRGYLSGTRDLSVEGFNYVMFYRPFEANNQQLVLCGFVKTQKYNSNLKRVPFYFIYPLAIAFVLLLCFMPILKFYVMDSNEKVRIRELIFFGLSVFTGAALLTLVITQLLVWKGEERKVNYNLSNLSCQIRTRFIAEIEKAYDQLTTVDSMRMLHQSLRNYAGTLDYSDSVKGFLKKLDSNGKTLYPFERISWINDSGRQVIKAELYGKPVFTNVVSRQYFQAIARNNPLFLTNGAKKFGFEPIYSRTNGGFNITISKQSDGYVAALATRMYSVTGTILPEGYRFCIIDEKGNVLLHSDGDRNLNENLFDKAASSDEIMRAAVARHSAYVNEVIMYGRAHLLHIEPLMNLPYSLVIFYDKGIIIPMNMRILIFSLLFCFFSALTCFVLWLILAPPGYSSHAIAYSPMDAMNWLRPTKDESGFYLHSSIFLFLYLILVLLFVFTGSYLSISNFSIFSIVLFTPVNLVCGIFVIRTAFTDPLQSFKWNKLSVTRRTAIFVTAAHFLITLLFFLFSRNNFPIDWFFLIFQLFFTGWMFEYAKSKKGFSPVSFKEKGDHLLRYNIMGSLLIICLAVLPSALFTWYAHNQEFLQAIKKHQLHLATAVNQRALPIIEKFSDNKDFPADTNSIKQLLYKEGIYTIYSDTIFPELRTINDPHLMREKSESFEQAYFAIAEAVRTPFNDPELYPAMADTASEDSWYWQKKNNSMHLYYRLPVYSSNPNQALHIRSELPPRFVFLNSPRKLFWIVPLILFLCWALYKWLRINIENVFLIKYFQKDSVAGSPENLVVKYCNLAPDNVSSSASTDTNLQPAITTEQRLDADRYEEQTLEQMRRQKKSFDYIMKHCTDKERYLLYEYAKYGLVNHKNKTEIYALIAKGLITSRKEKLQLFSPAFRAYLLAESETDEVQELQKKFQQNSTWQSVRGPLLLLLLGFLVLIFFTQEAIFQKILALAAGAGTLFSLIPKLFAAKSPATSEVK